MDKEIEELKARMEADCYKAYIAPRPIIFEVVKRSVCFSLSSIICDDCCKSIKFKRCYHYTVKYREPFTHEKTDFIFCKNCDKGNAYQVPLILGEMRIKESIARTLNDGIKKGILNFDNKK